MKIQPGEKIPDNILKELQGINEKYAKDRDFNIYLDRLGKLFNISKQNIRTEKKLFLAGYLEGEGSLSFSIKKNLNAKYGVTLDPEFNVTQHINGVEQLYTYLQIFQTGRITYKSGSNATLVFKISNRRSLEEKVIPFWNMYVAPYATQAKQQRFLKFQKVLELFREDCHTKLDCLTCEMLPLWDSMRMQKGQSNESFPDLQSAVDYVQTFVKKSKK